MNLREEIKPYLCYGKMISHTLVNGNLDPDGNPFISTALYYITLQKHYQLTAMDIRDWEYTLKSCEVSPGCYRRNTVKMDQEGPDDYNLINLLNKKISVESGKRVLDHGLNKAPKLLKFLKLKYFYNNENANSLFRKEDYSKPRKWYLKVADTLLRAPAGQIFNDSAWLGRQLQLRAAINWAAGSDVNFLLHLYVVGSIIKASYAKKEDQDAWLLSWALMETAPKTTLLNFAREHWYKKREQVFGEKRGEASTLAEHVLEFGHPISKYFIL